jgi:hypothetical protein
MKEKKKKRTEGLEVAHREPSPCGEREREPACDRLEGQSGPPGVSWVRNGGDGQEGKGEIALAVEEAAVGPLVNGKVECSRGTSRRWRGWNVENRLKEFC